MPKAFSFTAAQLDAVVGALETEISAVHNETMGEDADLGLEDAPLTDADVEDASRLLVTLVRTLEKLDPEHPLALEMPRPGVAYDFEAALDGDDDDEDDDDDPDGDLVEQYRTPKQKKPSSVAQADVIDGSFVKGRTETNPTRATGS